MTQLRFADEEMVDDPQLVIEMLLSCQQQLRNSKITADFVITNSNTGP